MKLRQSVQPNPIAGEGKRSVSHRRAVANDAESAQARERQRVAEQFWQALTPDEKVRAEAEAVAEAGTLERSILERGGAFGAAARRSILVAHALKVTRSGQQ